MLIMRPLLSSSGTWFPAQAAAGAHDAWPFLCIWNVVFCREAADACDVHSSLLM